MSLQVPRAAFRVLEGEPRSWTRATDGGGTLDCWFCDRCGSRLWHEADGASATVSIKAGCLDEPVDLAGATHIWTSRKLEGVRIPDEAERYPEEPPA